MTVISDLVAAFRVVGNAMRDLDKRLKAVEVRSAINYPTSETYLSSTVQNSTISREDGTRAMTIVYTTGQLPAGAPAPIGTDYSNIINRCTLTYYAPNGTTVVKTVVLTPTGDALGQVTRMGV